MTPQPAETTSQDLNPIAAAFGALFGGGAPPPALIPAVASHGPCQKVIADESTITTPGLISVTIVGHLGITRTRDGSWLVQVPADGSARVVAIESARQWGAMLNVRGTNTTDVHLQQPTLPLAVAPGDALVIAARSAGGREAYWDAPGRSQVDEAMAVVFVAYPVDASLLRPPAIGDGFLPRFFRVHPVPEHALDRSIEELPRVVDVDALPVNWGSWGAGKPTIPYLTDLLRRFGGECYDGWRTDDRTPDLQHPGYGTAFASVVSQAAVQLCSTASPEEKRPLALAVAQRGFDLASAFADGRVTFPLGGHCQGRKALIVLAGHLMRFEPFTDPTKYVGRVFAEDHCYTPKEWWPGVGWSTGWAFRIDAPFDGSMLTRPPAEWGPVTAPQHDAWAWMVAGYLPQVAGAQVGTALAMKLLGREREMGADFIRFIEQWMRGINLSADAQLRAAGIVLPWGTDYASVRGAGFCSAAWRSYVVER